MQRSTAQMRIPRAARQTKDFRSRKREAIKDSFRASIFAGTGIRAVCSLRSRPSEGRGDGELGSYYRSEEKGDGRNMKGGTF